MIDQDGNIIVSNYGYA